MSSPVAVCSENTIPLKAWQNCGSILAYVVIRILCTSLKLYNCGSFGNCLLRKEDVVCVCVCVLISACVDLTFSATQQESRFFSLKKYTDSV